MGRPEIVDFEGLVGLGGPKTPPTGGPLRDPPVGWVWGPAEAAQTPKEKALTKDTLRLGTHIRRSENGAASTTLRNHSCVARAVPTRPLSGALQKL